METMETTELMNSYYEKYLHYESIDMDMMLSLRHAAIDAIGVSGVVREFFDKEKYLVNMAHFVTACIFDSDYKNARYCVVNHKDDELLEYMEMFFGCDDISEMYYGILCDFYNVEL